ncbi:MAG: hypothetical protein AAF637_24760 [Pseudomonadota bacterium]
MTTAQQQLGLRVAGPDLAVSRRVLGVRFRLALALLGFAGLVVWGIVSEPNTAKQTVGTKTESAPIAARSPYDGHGKWRGYTTK